MDAMKIDQRCKANASAVLPPFCPPFGDFTKKGLRAITLSPLQFVLSEDRRKLPGQDLNLEWLDQNQLCYQLHHRAIRLSVVRDGRPALQPLVSCDARSLWNEPCPDNG